MLAGEFHTLFDELYIHLIKGTIFQDTLSHQDNESVLLICSRLVYKRRANLYVYMR